MPAAAESPAAVRTVPEQTHGMPGGIPYIIGNETAERFSFYGMKGILAVFMVNYLWLMGDAPGRQMPEAEATALYHFFNVLVYLLPLIGAVLADRFFGKYRIIIWLSVVYCLGHAALALMGTAGSASHWLFVGLLLIAIGSGGIKPCVSAHVGDQFGPNNQHLLPKIFNYFYFSINLGAFVAGLLTPWMLEWHGPHWAFGIPGVLMALATVMFWMGRRKFVHLPPAGPAFTETIFSKSGLKLIGKLIPLYVFVAIFWSLFDQTGTRWVFQAQEMDRDFLGIRWLPAQVQALNAALILLLIPVFAIFGYPWVNKFIPLTPLRKIGFGLFTMAAAFAVSSLIEVAISHGAKPNIGWQFLAYALLSAAEVLVSVVCLEFSYTQAPRALKSFIMSFYLLAVAAGNLVTGAVNLAILVPDPVAKQVEETLAELPRAQRFGNREVVTPGFDGVLGTRDDITAKVEAGAIASRTTPADAQLTAAAEILASATPTTPRRLPSEAEAARILEKIADPWGQPLKYELLNQRSARLTSAGPDMVAGTAWDIGLMLELNPLPGADGSPEETRTTWLERRRLELGLDQPIDAPAGAPPLFTTTTYTGGQPRLEGPAYYWSFTGLMFLMALGFIPYALAYRYETMGYFPEPTPPPAPLP
jgi:POT family proton-dependent oligopeptide transporter